MEKVIKALEVVRKGYVYKKNGQDVISLDVRFVDMILALLKEQGWIPITERLPKDDTDILVYCTDGEESRIVAVNYANGIWFDCIFNTVMVVKNITHWMPLPKPPTEGR